MAPVESYIQIDEDEKQKLFSLKPGEKRSTKKFPQAEITVKCDGLDINGTVKVKTRTPDFIGVFLYESDLDPDPKPLETGEEHSFSGTQKIEIHSTYHTEFISLRHKVAPGVVGNPNDALAAKAVLAHVEAIVRKKPLAVGASAVR